MTKTKKVPCMSIQERFAEKSMRFENAFKTHVKEHIRIMKKRKGKIADGAKLYENMVSTGERIMPKKRRGPIYDGVHGMWCDLLRMYPQIISEPSISKILSIILIMRRR